MFDMTDDELQDFIMDQFMRYDAGSGRAADRREFRELLMDAERLLSKKDARANEAEADENDDGAAEYREFVPIMVEIIHGIKAKIDAAAVTEEAEDEAEVVEMHLLHGMLDKELAEAMMLVFGRRHGRERHPRSQGVLAMPEIRRARPTRKEINLLLGEVDENNDGMVSYDEFVPLCFNILVERFKDDARRDGHAERGRPHRAPHRGVRGEGTQGVRCGGRQRHLSFSKVKRVLQSLSDEMLSLSRLQISAVMSEAKTDEESEERMVDYTVFALVAMRVSSTPWWTSPTRRSASTRWRSCRVGRGSDPINWTRPPSRR